MNGNIIEFKSETFKIKSKTINQKLCTHASVEVDEQTQMIECCSCGVIFSAYEYVIGLAKNEIRQVNRLKYVKVEREQLQVEVDELKRQRTNLKAQVRRAIKGAGNER